MTNELADQIGEHVSSPVVLVGHSWGAWLSALYTAANPLNVRTLILVGSGSFESVEDKGFEQRRIAHLPENEQREYMDILSMLNDPAAENKDGLLLRLGELSEIADTYCPLPTATENFTTVDGVMFDCVWKEAAEMRRSGRLLDMVKSIQCPIHVVHGTYDVHPVDGVIEPLKRIGLSPVVHLYEKCGHSPFNENMPMMSLLSFYAPLRINANTPYLKPSTQVGIKGE